MKNKEIRTKAIEYIKRQKQANLNWLNSFKEQANIKKNDFKELEKNMLEVDKMFEYILLKL